MTLRRCSPMALLTLGVAVCTVASAVMEDSHRSEMVEASEMLYFTTRNLQELGDNETIFLDDEDHLDDLEEHHDEDENHVDGHDDHDHDHDDHGHDHEEDVSLQEGLVEGSGSDKPWAEVIIASLLINLITLMGVFFLSGEFIAKHVFKKDVSKSTYYHAFTHNVIPSFACGALLATNVFLILPEALYLITAHFTEDSHEEELEDGHDGHAHRWLQEDDHKDADGLAVWRFGSCVIAGFLLPVFTSAMFPHNHNASDEVVSSAIPEEKEKLRDIPEEEKALDVPSTLPQDSKDTNASTSTLKLADATDGTEVGSLEDTDLPHPIDWSLATSIMAGDFFHNFADGIFIGTAFLLCSRELAITISAATIYHEIAQEIADYFMLTRFCHIPPFKALMLNFLNGLSVILGACLIVGIEDMTNVAIGSILAISGGVYIYIAVAECFPRAQEGQKTHLDKAVAFLAFVIGVVPIGLVLLNHTHCEAGHEH